MSAPTFTVLEAIERQAASCAHIGSPLYAQLLRGLAEDHRRGGLTAQLIEGISENPVHDAVPLRYLATVHRLALAGDAPELAAQYPSCGGSWLGDDLAPTFLAAVASHVDEVRAGLRRNVQTNEVGRAAALASGCSLVAERTGAVLRTLEIGASAGLLSRWPHMSFDTGQTVTGDPSSELRFGPEWFTTPAPHLVPGVRVVHQEANDISPIDVLTPAGELTALSFVWPDQDERRHRLATAIRIARAHPVHVEEGDAGTWLADRLAADAPDGTATIVFHSIVWQYLPSATKDRMRSALADAGTRSTSTATLHWLRMEPATAAHADLRLTTWPGGVEERLAEVGYHGADVRWLLPH